MLQSLADLKQGEPVYAISLRQPWAGSVIFLGKDIENRKSWPFGYRGPILIHASASAWDREDLERALDIAREDEVEEELLGYFNPDGYLPPLLAEGAIVGTVQLNDVIPPGKAIPKSHSHYGSPWEGAKSMYRLCFDDPEACKPQPYKGKVGIFKVPYEVAAKLQPLFSENKG